MLHQRIIAAVAALALVAAVVPASASTQGRAGWTPTPTPVAKGDITAVAALDAQRAWAVGYRLVSDNEAQSIALRWNGKAWTQESELPRDSFPQTLEVRAPNDIWAVGDTVKHWNGTAWSSVTFEPDPTGGFMPESLDSVPSGQAWVVGRVVGDSIAYETPAIHAWNGTTWTRQALPDVGKARLSTVVAVAPNDVWAAGFVLGAPQTSLVLHWDGTRWTKMPAPSVPGNHTWIAALHADADGLWAVGGSNSGTADRPFAARWNGRNWQITTTPRIPDGRLRAVTTTGDGSVWAVGGKGAVTVALRWNKVLRAWVRVPAPDLNVRGFAAVPGSPTLWSVGIAKEGDLVPAIARYR